MKSVSFFILILITALALFSCKEQDSSDGGMKSQGAEHVCEYGLKTESIPATCVSGGYTRLTCSCGKTQITDETEPLGHSWLAWSIIKVPTQETTGSAKRVCENGHAVTLTLPKLDLESYDLTALSEDVELHCLVPVAVRCIYAPPIYDDTESGESIEFISEYLLNHSYSGSYVHSDSAHYSVCSFCSTVDEDSAAEHTLSDGICTVCGYEDQGLIYSAEEYGIAVSYGANGTRVAIPEFYMEHYVPKEENRIKGIKSFCGTELRSITIPASIEYIEDLAFEGCSMLERVYYNGTWDQWCSIRFGEGANPMNYAREFYIFNGTTYDAVSDITLTDAVSVISSHALEGFDYIASLTVPKTVTKLGDGTGAVFGDGLRVGKIYYGGDVADWCNVTVNSHRSSPTYVADVFYMTNADGEYYAPTEIVIPSTVKRIGAYQFTGYRVARSIKLEGAVDEIGEGAFLGCVGLKTADISAGCTVITGSVFSGCETLHTVYLPSDLVSSGAFAFYECFCIENVYFKGTAARWCSIKFINEHSTPLRVNAERTLENSATLYLYLDASNEYYSTDSETLVIPKGITEIGNYQFLGFAKVSELILSDGVTSIGDKSFAHCTNLTRLVIPKSVTEIGESVLSGYNAYLEIHYGATADEWERISVAEVNAELRTATLICSEEQKT